jgi:hypothetical protein
MKLFNLFRKSSEQEQLENELTQNLNQLQKRIRACGEKIHARNQFYASLPLGREGELKLPRNQWAYFLRGKVGIRYDGETLTSSVTQVKTREEVQLPRIIDAERSHKLLVIRGYVIDRRTNRTYYRGETVSFPRGEPMQLTLNGHVHMLWTPPLPGAIMPFYQTNIHGLNS